MGGHRQFILPGRGRTSEAQAHPKQLAGAIADGIAAGAWDRWVSDAISDGASAAHKWTNAPNVNQPDITAAGARGPLRGR